MEGEERGVGMLCTCEGALSQPRHQGRCFSINAGTFGGKLMGKLSSPCLLPFSVLSSPTYTFPAEGSRMVADLAG